MDMWDEEELGHAKLDEIFRRGVSCALLLLSLADQSLHLLVEWAISSARHLVGGNENGLPTPDFVLTFLPIDPCEFKGLRK